MWACLRHPTNTQMSTPKKENAQIVRKGSIHQLKPVPFAFDDGEADAQALINLREPATTPPASPSSTPNRPTRKRSSVHSTPLRTPTHGASSHFQPPLSPYPYPNRRADSSSASSSSSSSSSSFSSSSSTASPSSSSSSFEPVPSSSVPTTASTLPTSSTAWASFLSSPDLHVQRQKWYTAVPDDAVLVHRHLVRVPTKPAEPQLQQLSMYSLCRLWFDDNYPALSLPHIEQRPPAFLSGDIDHQQSSEADALKPVENGKHPHLHAQSNGSRVHLDTSLFDQLIYLNADRRTISETKQEWIKLWKSYRMRDEQTWLDSVRATMTKEPQLIDVLKISQSR